MSKTTRRTKTDLLLEFAVQIIVFVIYLALFRFIFDAPSWGALVGATIMQRLSLVSTSR